MCAVKSYVKNKFGVEISDDDIVPLYRFCQFHFMQSVTRISRNGSIVPLNLQYRFKKDVQQLQNEDKYDCFENLCYSFFKKYPKAKSWLCWYLQPDRSRIIFPACKDMRDEYEQH